jgi:lipoprotein-releasing system permease protein
MNFTLRLAYCYLFSTKQEYSISHMTRICFLSIFIGCFSLTVVTIIMNGFEKATCNTIRGLNASLIIEDPTGQALDFLAIENVILQEFPLVTTISPTSDCHVIIMSPESDDTTNVIIVRGINPIYEERMHTIKNAYLSKKLNLSSLVEKNKIIIGYKLAKTLGVKEGDIVDLLIPQPNNIKKNVIMLKKNRAYVSSLIKVGIDEIDSRLAIASLAFLQKLFPDIGITQINVCVNKEADEKTIAQHLSTRTALSVYSWKDLYPALISALLLEKYAMFFILALITLVASMNIISLLCMYLTYKRSDLAILLSMGMRQTHARYVFVTIGMSIAFCASVSGLVAAYIVGYILEHYPFIPLPDTYYISYLPAHMEWHIFLFSFLVMIIISFCATWFPTGTIKKMNISNVLRFEA